MNIFKKLFKKVKETVKAVKDKIVGTLAKIFKVKETVEDVKKHGISLEIVDDEDDDDDDEDGRKNRG